jgi:hypothetical protein
MAEIDTYLFRQYSEVGGAFDFIKFLDNNKDEFIGILIRKADFNDSDIIKFENGKVYIEKYKGYFDNKNNWDIYEGNTLFESLIKLRITQLRNE